MTAQEAVGHPIKEVEMAKVEGLVINVIDVISGGTDRLNVQKQIQLDSRVRVWRNQRKQQPLQEAENAPEVGEALVLLKPVKEATDQTQQKALFRTICKSRGKCCKLIIDNDSTDNLVSTEMVEKLELKHSKHPNPYRVSWLQNGHQFLVDEQSEVEFQIGRYKEKFICDIMSMDVCHILLGRPWQYDRKVVHDGLTNCYKFVKDGIKHMLVPIKEEWTTKTGEPRTLLVSDK